MTKTINYFKSALVGTGLVIAIATAFLISTPQAKAAEFPNILVGQNLTVGSTGQSVVVLQGLMSELGYLRVPQGIPFGYYGTLTKNAVAQYQASMNVSPAVGYYGPLTKVAMYSNFSSHGWLQMLGW